MPALSPVALRAILRTDGLRLSRDRFLLGMLAYIVGTGLALRWMLPWLTVELAVRANFDLTPWYTLLTSHFVVGLAGLLAGLIGGFLLIESREDNTARALMVTPVSLGTYVDVLCMAVFAGSLLLIVFQGAVIERGVPAWYPFLGATLAAAPAAPVFSLFIAALADNKTTAFAYMKICSVAPLIPTAAYFLPEPWQWLAAVYPPYWAAKAYWTGAAGGELWPIFVVGGLLTSAVWMVVLRRRFLNAARR